MNTTDLTRRLSAILSADVEGYSRLMRDDEEATVQTITTYRTAMTHLIQEYRGRVVDSPGDNILAEFTSVVDLDFFLTSPSRNVGKRGPSRIPASTIVVK
jgi:adenylate cyclase